MPFGFDTGATAATTTAASTTPLATRYPVLFALLNAIIYYADFGTDFHLAIEANQVCQMETPGETAPTVLPYILIVVMCLHPVAMSYADLFAEGGMRWFGVLLNFTNTRMLYAFYKAVSEDGSNAAAAAKSASDVKLFEAVLESMPQLHLQAIYLLFYPECVGGPVSLYISLTLSTVSIVFALATKFQQLFDKAGNALFALAVWLYFTSDVIVRGVSTAMIFGAFGGGGLAVCFGVWAALDLVWQVVIETINDSSIEHICFRPCLVNSISLPSTLLSLFTSMPLSTKVRDRTRLFFLSTCATFVMALCGTSGEYKAVFDLPTEASDETKAVFLVVLAVKSLVYLFVLRGGVLEKGQGAQEAAGFSALFALSAIAGDQMEFWTGNEWANFARDPANRKVDLNRYKNHSYCGIITAGAAKSMAVGIKRAGAECKIEELELGQNSIGPAAGKLFADMLKVNTSLVSVKNRVLACHVLSPDNVHATNSSENYCNAVSGCLGGTFQGTPEGKLGPVGGAAIADALTVNKTLKSIVLGQNDFGHAAGRLFAKALTVNKSITNINLYDNNFGWEIGFEIADALRINTTVQTIHLQLNDFDAAEETLKDAWGDRKPASLNL